MIDRMILFVAGVLIALLAAPAQGDPWKSVRPDPWRGAKVVTPQKAQVCPCGCGCKDCDPSRPCDCGCPCGLQYTNPGDGFRYEFKGGKYTGRAWDMQGRLWLDGQLANPPRAVRAGGC